MVKPSGKSALKALTEKQQQWFQFLRTARRTPKNRNLMGEYLLSEFEKFPQEFYSFLSFLRTWLKSSADRQQKKDIAQKYLDVLLPLCERFGFAKERDLLNDICFRMTAPEEYDKIHKAFLAYKKKSSGIIRRILRILRKATPQERYPSEIIGRYKNIYSIFQKTHKKKGTNLFSLKDIFAFRIILEEDSKEKCFEVLNILHDQFYPLPERFKDYISIPKINGYQSLHTGLKEVIADLDLPIEVQIRTKAMHRFAEAGVAAHWLYAKTKSSFSHALLFHTSRPDIQEHDWVYFFSYQGDLFQMERNSTALDFAYHIHTDIGNKAKYAMVNDRTKMDISYRIQEGDMIKIIESNKPEVQTRWLKLAKSKLTRRKISSFLHSHVAK